MKEDDVSAVVRETAGQLVPCKGRGTHTRAVQARGSVLVPGLTTLVQAGQALYFKDLDGMKIIPLQVPP